MKLLLAVVVLLALPAAGAESPLPQLRVEPTTGGSIFFVKNVASQPLTGYLIELVDYPGSYYALWQDEVGAEALAPNQEKRIQVGNMTVGAVPDYVKLQAAVYSDGTTAGVPEKVTQLIARRRFTLQTVRETIARLEKAQAAHLPKEELIATLKQAAEALSGKGAPTSQPKINQAAGSKVLSETAAHLARQSVEETLAGLQAWEKALAASKPAL